ncbi:MAG: alpha-E domain-containing protein [Burkholderiaceae bacterium]
MARTGPRYWIFPAIESLHRRLWGGRGAQGHPLLHPRPENPWSIISSIRAAHDNARTLRHLISVEMWTQINIFYNQLLKLRARDVTEAKLTAVCAQIKNACQLFEGCTRNTLYRDQVWHFYRTGRLIERCDQITRLVDIKGRPKGITKAALVEAIDVSQWHTLLRSASAYHGYLRSHREISSEAVASYILFDPGFPGSIVFCSIELQKELANLKRYVGEKQIAAVTRELRTLLKLAKPSAEHVHDDARHDYLDSVQIELMKLHGAIAKQFFPQYEPLPA